MYLCAKVVERATSKNGEIQLQKRGDNYEIIFNGTFIMATYDGTSERLLASLAIERVKKPRSVLIGGLGVGFTLGEALKYGLLERVTVVEIEEKVIDWNRTYLSPYSNHGLKDKRVRMVHDDLTQWMVKSHDKYDVICLDIDNGPDWLVIDSNTKLYEESGIYRLAHLLREKGVLSLWSANKSQMLEEKLKEHFGHVDIKTVAHTSGQPDYIYLAYD